MSGLVVVAHLLFGGEEHLNVSVGELAVNTSESSELLLDFSDILGVKVDLVELGLILADTDALTNDLGRVDNILEDSVVDSGQSAGDRALLTTALAGLSIEDGALSNDDNMSTSKLLLELTNETSLNLEVALVLAVRDEDDNSTAIVDLNLLSRSNSETSKLSRSSVSGRSNVTKSLDNLLLEFRAVSHSHDFL